MVYQNLQRLHYIDWIRVIAFSLLIFFHCSMPFVQFGWEIKNKEHSSFLSSIIIWLHQWRLPLLFFISGVGVSLSLKKRSVIKFFGERVIRLFIPLLFSMFFTIPLQVYFEWMQEGKINQSYWSFYPSVWEMVPYPDGTLTWSHMWFVVYLFVFTILLLPVFAIFKIKFIQEIKKKLNFFMSYAIVMLSFSIPFIIYFFTLFIKWPEQGSLVDDWFVFTSSITFYFLGFFLQDLDNFWNFCEKYRRQLLYFTIVLISILFWKYYWKIELPKTQNSNLYYYGILNGMHIWVIILTIIGYSKQYLNYTNSYLKYLSKAVYPFYILHQTVIVAFGYYIVQWNLPIIVKLLSLIIICFLTIFGLYHLLIRPFILPRILFGLKMKR